MTPQSAKAKGRNLQKWFANKLVEILHLDPADIESRPMGSNGADIIIGVASRTKFPYNVEAKNQERLNLWAAWEQALSNQGDHKPLLVVKRNRQKPLVVLDAEDFLHLLNKSHERIY